MSSDYGDDAGEMMFNYLVRLGERVGGDAMRQHAQRLSSACERACEGIGGEKGESIPERPADEWAKLDMSEFQEIGAYEETKAVIEGRLAEAGIDPTWFQDPKTGTDYLLFKVRDAREVRQCFDGLSGETLDAASRAAEKTGLGSERDARPLGDRAAEARRASDQLESERGGARRWEREPRFEGSRAR